MTMEPETSSGEARLAAFIAIVDHIEQADALAHQHGTTVQDVLAEMVRVLADEEIRRMYEALR